MVSIIGFSWRRIEKMNKRIKSLSITITFSRDTVEEDVKEFQKRLQKILESYGIKNAEYNIWWKKYAEYYLEVSVER